jgi:hypothetical protein
VSGVPYFEALPRWLRIIGRVLRIASYVALLMLAVGDLLLTPAEFIERPVLVLAWSVPIVIFSVMALYAVSRHLWRWEWTLTFWLAACVALRALTVWSYPGPPYPLSSGALVTFASTMLCLRGLDLTVFAIRTGAWRVRATAWHPTWKLWTLRT